MTKLANFHIDAAIILRRGPVFKDGVTTVTLSADPEFTVTYEAHPGEIREITQVLGAPGGGQSRFNPPGVLCLKVSQLWVVMNDEADHAIGFIRLSPEQAKSMDQRVAKAIQAAMAAFEASTDAYVESWGTLSNAVYWVDDQGKHIKPAGASTQLESSPGASISQADALRYSKLLKSFYRTRLPSVLGAYSVARLRRDHLPPAARVVFTWALLERINSLMHRGKRFRHHEVKDKVLKACQADVASEQTSPVELARVEEAIEEAYDLRNGLAHGEPADTIQMDFPALARAVVLMLRRLAAQRP